MICSYNNFEIEFWSSLNDNAIFFMILVLFDSYEGYFFLKKTSLNSLGLHFIYLSRVPNFWRRSWPSIYNETRQRDCGRDTKTTQRVDTSQREAGEQTRCPGSRSCTYVAPPYRGSLDSLVWVVGAPGCYGYHTNQEPAWGTLPCAGNEDEIDGFTAVQA